MITKEKLAELQREGQAFIAKAKEIAKANGEPSTWSEATLKDYNDNIAKAGEKLEQIHTAKADLAVIDKAHEIGEAIGMPFLGESSGPPSAGLTQKCAKTCARGCPMGQADGFTTCDN